MENVLIVVDMQKDFVDGALGTKEAVLIVPKVCERIKSFNGRIIVTKDTHTEDYLNTQEGRLIPVKHCIKDTYGWQLDRDVEEALREKEYETVEKGSFGSLLLLDRLKLIKDIGSIELIGLCTDICVVSNAMLIKAGFPEIPMSVDASCCAGVTTESHEAALATMKMCQIDVH